MQAEPRPGSICGQEQGSDHRLRNLAYSGARPPGLRVALRMIGSPNLSRRLSLCGLEAHGSGLRPRWIVNRPKARLDEKLQGSVWHRASAAKPSIMSCLMRQLLVACPS